MNKEERQAVKLEFNAYSYLEKQLQHTAEKISYRVTSDKVKRENREKALLQYKTADELQDAYGYGDITQEEYCRLLDLLEGVEAKIAFPSKYEMALSELNDIIRKVRNMANEFEYILLPDEEKKRRDQEAEALRQRVDAHKLKRTEVKEAK